MKISIIKRYFFFSIIAILFTVIAIRSLFYSKYNKIYWHDEKTVIAHKKLKNHYENFSPIDVIRNKIFFEELNKKNYFMFSGVSNSNTVISCDDHIWIRKLDKFGFLNKSEDWENTKTFAFGDSLTYGSCSEKNFIEILNLNKKEKIINLSAPGNNLAIDIALLKELIIKQKNNSIKQVYFFIYESSLSSINLSKKNFILSKYFNSKNFNLNYFQNKNEMDFFLIKDYEKNIPEKYNIRQYLTFIEYLIISIRNKLLVKENLIDLKKDNLNKESINENINLFIGYLKILNKLSYENNFKYKFIFIPNKNFLSNDSELYIKVKEYLNKNQENFYEIKNLVSVSQLEKFYIETSNNFSDYGNREIAKILNDTLKLYDK